MKSNNRRRFELMLTDLEKLNNQIEAYKMTTAKETLKMLRNERRALVKSINKLLGDEKIPMDSIVSISVNNTLNND